MATDKQITQWIEQGYRTTNIPEKLYWLAYINENKEVIKLEVTDELFHKTYKNDLPAAFPDRVPARMRLVDEDVQIGDTLV